MKQQVSETPEKPESAKYAKAQGMQKRKICTSEKYAQQVAELPGIDQPFRLCIFSVL
jgi:hypothetical protein